METNSEGSFDPAELLAQADADTARFRSRLMAPWWYYVALGVLSGGFIMLIWALLGDHGSPIPLVAIGCAGVALLVSWYQRKTGVSVSGATVWSSRRKAFMAVLIALALAAAGVSVWTGVTGQSAVLPLSLSVVLALTMAIGGCFVDKADLLGGGATGGGSAGGGSK